MKSKLALFSVGIIFHLFSLTIFAQKGDLVFDEMPLFYYSETQKSFRVYKDSLLFTFIGDNNWKIDTVHFDNSIQKEGFSEEYTLVSNNGKDYLISKGCGQVYHLIDNNFVRIDHSFAHKNQYNSALFFHNNQPYFFGGYGLFTTKNILTYFDFEKGEWFLTFAKNNLKPSPRANVYYQKIDNVLYIIGGENSENNIEIYQSDIWTYNFNSCCWKKLGHINPLLKQYLQGGNWNCYHPTSFVVFGPHLLELLPAKNKVREYINDKYSRILDIVQDDKGNCLVASGNLSGKIQIKVLKRKDLIGKPNRDYMLIVNHTESNFSTLLIIVLCLLFFILVFVIGRNFKKRKLNQSHELSDLEKEICKILLSNGEEGVELSALNVLLDDGQSNYEALKKRREIKMRDLRLKLAEYSKLPASEVILDKKSDKDKRIKLSYLNPKIKL